MKTSRNVSFLSRMTALRWAKMREVPSPDGSRVFLHRHLHFNEDAGVSTYYAIEAPRNCPMREAFEWGNLTWDEYWTHKDYLYRLLVPFNLGPVVTTKIRSSEIDHQAMLWFRTLGDRFPYELKREQLELAWKHSSWSGLDPVETERAYREFMKRFGHRFSLRAA